MEPEKPGNSAEPGPEVVERTLKPSNFEEQYLHFQRSGFHKFNVKLFRKERPFKRKKHFFIETKFGG